MTWETKIRIVKDTEGNFSLRKCKYKDGELYAINAKPKYPVGRSFNELARDFEIMSCAFGSGVIDETDFLRKEAIKNMKAQMGFDFSGLAKCLEPPADYHLHGDS